MLFPTQYFLICSFFSLSLSFPPLFSPHVIFLLNILLISQCGTLLFHGKKLLDPMMLSLKTLQTFSQHLYTFPYILSMFLMHHTLDSLNCDSLKPENLLGLGPMKLLTLLNSACSFSEMRSSLTALHFQWLCFIQESSLGGLPS